MPSSESVSSSKKRSTTPDGRCQRVKKRKKHVSKGKRKSGSDSEEPNSGNESTDSASESDNLGVNPAECKTVGRAIARCYDMFADVNKIISLMLLSKQAEAANNGDLSESEDEMTQQHREKSLDEISTNTMVRYKRIYALLLRLVPGIKVLIDNRTRLSERKKVGRKINQAINEARSNDMGKLRDKIASYATPNPSVALIPPILPGSSRSQMGLNHPVLAGYLCPIDSVQEYLVDPEGTRKKLESGKIKMSSTNFPAFLWEDNGRNVDEDNMLDGFFRGFYVERVMRHIFTGPSTGMGGDARGSKPNNSQLSHMDSVGGAQLAYAAVQARFAISSKTRWGEKDGTFNYRKYYYALIEIIDECEDAVWRDRLLKHYNMLLFKDEKGRENEKADDDEEHSDNSAKKPGVLSRMRAQATARASAGIGTNRPSSTPMVSGNNALASSATAGTIDESSPPSDTVPANAKSLTGTVSTSAAQTTLIFESPAPFSPIPRDLAVAPQTSGPSVAEASLSLNYAVPHATCQSPQTGSVTRDQEHSLELSDLSDLEQEEQRTEKARKKRTAIRKGKKKAIAVGSDEERDIGSSARTRRKGAKKGKK